ncbi:Gfo/Idh/MocA family oxidoreductase [Streptomyces olivaceoviridis]|uniref:Gfo/Idh/MocA family oxidoreductase n=1 Tax=Streptomyces olivaceoviridis TaxID=1921 RepID=UPI0033BD8CC4
MNGEFDAVHVCVVGYGVVGTLHTRLLTGLGFRVSVVERNAAVWLPDGVRGWRTVEDVPADTVDVWLVCTPTEDHLRTLIRVLALDPAARVLLEKPACRTAEIDRMQAVLAAHPRLRVAVMDQYRDSAVIARVRETLRTLAPGEPVRRIRVAFSKDRRLDVRRGRFVDRDHGVFGYEWHHMLAILGGLLPPARYGSYLARPVASGELRCLFDEQFVISAALEKTWAGPVQVELFSTVVGDPAAAGTGVGAPAWTADFPLAHGGRQRLVRVESESAHVTAELEPVGQGPDGPLPRNVHRITARTPAGRVDRSHVTEFLMSDALRRLITLLRDGSVSTPDLRTLHRIALLSSHALHVGRLPHAVGPSTG